MTTIEPEFCEMLAEPGGSAGIGPIVPFCGLKSSDPQEGRGYFAAVEAHVRDWTSAEVARRDNLADLEAQIRALECEIALLAVQQASAKKGTSPLEAFASACAAKHRLELARFQLATMRIRFHLSWRQAMSASCADGNIEVFVGAMDPWLLDIAARLADTLNVAAAQPARAIGMLDGYEFDLDAQTRPTGTDVAAWEAQQTDAAETASAGGVGTAMRIWQAFVDPAPADSINTQTQLALAFELADAHMLPDPFSERLAWRGEYVTSGLAARLARDFFYEEIAGSFVRNYLAELSRRAARVRTLVPSRAPEPDAETGSAATIARRMNPHGAPPEIF